MTYSDFEWSQPVLHPLKPKHGKLNKTTKINVPKISLAAMELNEVVSPWSKKGQLQVSGRNDVCKNQRET